MAMSAARTAGRLGDGGGPGTRRRIFPRPRPTVPGEAEVLQKGHGDHDHEGVVVEPMPAPALEVVEAEFLLHLLVRLLADPARLDEPGEALDRGVGGQVGEVVLRLAGGAALADFDRDGVALSPIRRPAARVALS